jgi:hypothetical protein
MFIHQWCQLCAYGVYICAYIYNKSDTYKTLLKHLGIKIALLFPPNKVPCKMNQPKLKQNEIKKIWLLQAQ